MVKQSITEKPSTTTTSGGASDERNDTRFKGVRKRKWGKYVSEIRLPNSRERIWLGSYDTAEKAARAFDAALFCLRGRSAKFNFPDNPPDIAGGRSLSPPEIQAAAASFANSSKAPPPPPPPPAASCCAGPELGSESPSQSLSDGSLTAQLDGEFPNDTSFMEFFSNMGLNPGYDSGYGLFPGFDDLGADFYAPPFSGTNDYVVEDNYYEEVMSQESFLWNF